MTSSRPRLLAMLGVCLLALAACGRPPPPRCGDGKVDVNEQCDDGNHINGDGCESDCTLTPSGGPDGGEVGFGRSVCGNGRVEAGEVCDDGNTADGDSCNSTCTVETVTCAAVAAPAAGASCSVISGTSGTLYVGTVLGENKVFVNGGVLVDASGTIHYVGCNYAGAAGASAATQVLCPGTVISPGLINSHDHITFQATPYVEPRSPDGGYVGERYEQRHDWRTGKNGHTVIPNYDPPQSGSTNEQIRWGELRQVLAGTTSVAGSGGQDGLLRNLDKGNAPSSTSGWQEAPFTSGTGVHFDTFPLGDSSGTQLQTGCGYSSLPSFTTDVSTYSSYLPHISEGIRGDARNEFLCLSGQQAGGVDILGPTTAVIHAVGLTGTDIGVMAYHRSSLVWSPRSNVSLYGDTAMVTAFQHLGVNIALGTDWVRSGSMNVLRELKCADYLNQVAYKGAFTDYQLWRMVTANAADALGFGDRLGRLTPGYVADLAFFKQGSATPYRAVIAANPEDVVLTVRGGKVLYGDSDVVAAMGAPGCTPLSGLGAAQSCLNSAKTVCLDLDNREAWTTLLAANGTTYPLAFCGGATPQNEPSCTPERLSTDPRFPAIVNGSHPYSIAASLQRPANDQDGDGVADDQDNCPGLFNPIRPMDDGRQPDSDGDGVGDACDACPLDATTTTGPCRPFDPTDVDGDGVLNGLDTCPYRYDPAQLDTDGDGKGDACDPCPTDANPGTLLCPGTRATIYKLKTPTSGGGFSPLLNQQVRLQSALVTAVGPATGTGANTFFLQDTTGPAEYSAIYVFRSSTATPAVAVGDVVAIDTARFQLFSGELELSGPQTVTKVGTGTPPVPTPVLGAEVADGGARAVALEGVVVDVARGATVISVDNTNLEFTLSDGVIVGQFLSTFPLPAVGQTVEHLRGVLAFRGGHYKVEPRAPADFGVETVHLTGFAPDGQYIRAGQTGFTFPQPLALALDKATDHAVTVVLTSSAPADLQASSVTIPAGSTTINVPLTAVNPNASVTLTARFNGASLTAHVQVVDANATAHLQSLTPALAVVASGGTATFTATLDGPALEPTEVTFGLVPSVTGATVGSLSATSIFIPVNSTSAMVTFTPDANPTDNLAHVTATVASTTLSATVGLAIPPARLLSLTSSPASLVPGGAGKLTLGFNVSPPSDVAVDLSASSGSFFQQTFPMSVTVPANSPASYDIPVTASLAATGTVTVTASASAPAGTDTAQASIQAVQPALSDFTPHSVTTGPGSNVTLTVTLSPTPAQDTVVTLSVPTPFFTTSPTSVTVPAGSATATVPLTIGATATGTAQVSATLGGTTLQAQVTSAGATHVVISEISAGNTGNSRDEFIELYNPTGNPVDLTGWTVQYRAATGTSYSGSFAIPSTGTHVIPAHGYFLLAGSAYTGGVAPDVSYTAFDMSASTTTGGHIRIGPNLNATNLNDPSTVDKIGWGTAAGPEGSAAPSHPAAPGSLERKAFATSTKTSMAPGGADEKAGNGYDSDNNATDFLQRDTRDPQNSTMHEP